MSLCARDPIVKMQYSESGKYSYEPYEGETFEKKMYNEISQCAEVD